jgi:GNAT superfamily N-acetyltransferase
VLVTEPIGAVLDLASFDSGEPALDLWLRDHARTTEARRTGRTFVWYDAGRVTGYYTISAHRLQREELPRSVGRGNPAEIPAVLLGKLALDRTVQGSGLGGVLLADALTRIVLATAVVGARFVVVDALHEKAATFYEHYEFRRIPDPLRDPDVPQPVPPMAGCRLIQKISSIAASLGPG